MAGFSFDIFGCGALVMIALVIFLACLLSVCAVGFLATVSDVRGMTIPNMHALIVVGGYVVCYSGLYLLGVEQVLPPLMSSLIAAGVFFAVTFIMFALKMLGAADSKLGTAYVLWIGLKGLPVFLFYMTVFGGLLGLASLAMRRWTFVKNPPPGSWFEKAQNGESKVPYGGAIFAGVLASFFELGYFSYETLVSILSLA